MNISAKNIKKCTYPLAQPLGYAAHLHHVLRLLAVTPGEKHVTLIPPLHREEIMIPAIEGDKYLLLTYL